DANAAHQNAIMWAITGNKRYAEKSIEIINAWSTVLKSITGRDAVLMAGLGPFKMVNAAEIIRYTNAGWKQEDIDRAEKHFREVIYPVIKDYAPFANGNWDAAALKTGMAIAVFCNDRPFFESALRYYTNGWGNGSIGNYIVSETGQVQESGRDQPHSQLGIGMLAECCAIAWNQGLDLYGYDHNRLLKGFEYTARYNLGNSDMPFSEWTDRTGKYHHTAISDKGRGNLRAVYEQVYNHYVILRHLPAPFVKQAVEKIRPEGPGLPGADHPGYGTLFFAGKSGAAGSRLSAPAGLVAGGTEQAVALKWVAVVNASSYSIKRATNLHGPFLTIANGIKEPHFTDKNVQPHMHYYYTVSA
ncbi:MAG: alginate lyase family protein, partial [Bacteroidetes bacterium]|nr:alginate lyase family protein [Bacteroidota bacterium]